MTERKKFTKGNSMAISAPLTRGERKKMANTPGLPEKKKKQIKASFQFFNFTNVANGINQGVKKNHQNQQRMPS